MQVAQNRNRDRNLRTATVTATAAATVTVTAGLNDFSRRGEARRGEASHVSRAASREGVRGNPSQ